MSRRLAEETTERLRPGKPQEGSSASLVPTHVRSSVSFLNPDISIGATNLERAPSLNRLHAQSSTETSGLGETVTSGFSSQESVLSYVGDDRERGGGGVSYAERSRRRPGGSPGSGRTLTDQDLGHKEDNHRGHPGLAKQHISKHQRQQQQNLLAIPHPGQPATGGEIKAYPDDDPREEYDSRFLEHHQTSARRQKPTRDTGGRSLTPQQAREEFEGRQRKLKQGQQDREAALYISPRSSHADLRSGSVSNSSEKQRRPSNPSQKQKDRDSFELSSIKEQHAGDTKVRLYSSGNNPSKTDPKFADYRPVFKGDRSDRTHSVLETSKPIRKEPSSHPTSSRPSGASGSRDSTEGHSSVIPSSDSKESSDWTEAASANRGRSSSQIISRDREKRTTSRSRDQLKSQSSSPKTNSDEYNESSGSKKSYETQILNRQSPHAKSSSSGELTEVAFIPQQPEYIDSQRISDKQKRREQSSAADVKKAVLKSSDSHSEVDISTKVSQTRRSKEDGNIKKQHQEVHSPRKRSNDRDQVEIQSKSAYYRQRNEPVETTRAAQQQREYEQSKSLEKHKVSEQLGRNSTRQVRQNEQEYAEAATVREPRRDDTRRTGRSEARDASDQVNISNVRDIDLGPILIRGAAVVRVHEARARDQGVKEKQPQEDRLRDRSRDRRESAKDRSAAGGRSHDSSRRPHTKHSSPDELSAKGTSDRESVPQLRSGYSQDGRSAARPVASSQGGGVETMNYERLFHQASRDMNGAGGGGGSETYPASFTGSQPSSSSSRGAAGVHGQSYNNISRNSQAQPPNHSQSLTGATNISSPNRPDKSAPLKTSVSYSTPEASTKTPQPVPTVQLTSVEDPRLNIDNVGQEWQRRDSRSSNRSGTSSRFLGVNAGSAWAKWSRERRASYRRRLEKMEQINPKTTTDTTRISTPIKKARQEGLKFVHPDLEARYLSEDDLNELRRHKQQQVQAMRVIERSRRHKFRLKNELKLTPEQWHLLQEFWNHTFFVRARFLGIIISFITIIFMIVSITHHSWLKHSEWNSTIVEGLWINCTQSSVIPNSSQGCTSSNGRSFEGGLWDRCYQNQSDLPAVATCPDRRSNWQNAVIGLLIFAATFGFLASILSICGVFTNPLPRKIYYFHSAGEIFLICALSSSVALIVFPIAVELDDSIHSHQYGIGYGLGWVGTFFLSAAAICMSLDDLVRESSRAKCCRWCWRGKHNERGDLRQV